MTEQLEKHQEEIELIAIFWVIWKWKYLILVGTAALALIAGVISFNRPKVYRITTVLKPGVVKIDKLGRSIDLDSANNMKSLLETKTFSNEIRTYLKALKVQNKPGSVKFRIAVPKRSNLLKISYETQHVDTGILILNHIPELLQKEYAEKINHFEKEYDDKIQKKMLELADIEVLKEIVQSEIIIFEKRLKELVLAINNIENNNSRIVEEKESYNRNSNEGSVNIDLLYNNAIQQNLQLMDQYKMQFSNLLSKKESAKLELKRKEEIIRFMSTEIADMKKEKSNVKYIEVLLPPTGSRSPIRPKVKLNIMLGAMLGFFATLFLAFLLEYLSKWKKIE